jgi:DNA modification methylase
MDPLTLINADCLTALRALPAESVQCCVTSPPYFGLRDYGMPDRIGLEESPAAFVETMVAIFEEVRRVLRPDGTLWLNLGDSYAGSWGAQSRDHSPGKHAYNKSALSARQIEAAQRKAGGTGSLSRTPGLKAKDLIGIPWRVAFALQAAGWYLRCDIIWHKPNPMPESITDRPTKAHEYIFLLTKSERYYYDAEAIKEPTTGNAHHRGDGVNPKAKVAGANSRVHVDRDPAHQTAARIRAKQNRSFSAAVTELVDSRNKRSVWSVPSAPYRGAHFATFPPNLIKPCIMAGTKPGDVVLDPFGGSGTTAAVALELARRALLIELNPEYCDLIRQRCAITPGLALSA